MVMVVIGKPWPTFCLPHYTQVTARVSVLFTTVSELPELCTHREVAVSGAEQVCAKN